MFWYLKGGLLKNTEEEKNSKKHTHIKEWFSNPDQLFMVTYAVLYGLDILIDALHCFRAEHRMKCIGGNGSLTSDVTHGVG